MKTRKNGLFVTAILALGAPLGAQGPIRHIGDGPAVRHHADQAEIESGSYTLDEILLLGRRLFEARFNQFDGRGRPAATGAGVPTPRDPDGQPAFIRTSAPDANSCAGCHNQPRVGGAGDFVANVFVLAQVLDPVTESVSPEFSNSRNTLGMFGAGAIEMLAREMTHDLLALRSQALAQAAAGGSEVTIALQTKGVDFGRLTARPDGSVDTSGVEGVNPDLIIRPFHQKGAVISLREFTNNAMNHHHGMQSVERFGIAMTGTDDFDQDGVSDELTVGDITAVTLFQAALGNPGQVIPNDPAVARAIIRGRRVFEAIGCDACHRPAMILHDPFFTEPNPFNPPGNLHPDDVVQLAGFDLTSEGTGPYLERTLNGGAIVRAFTDLKRHNLCDAEINHFCNERVPQGGISTEVFLTRKLWDVGNSAPYGHVGDLSTLTEAILMHGGEARASRDAFAWLPQPVKDSLVEFLKSLQVLPEGAEFLVVDEHGRQAAPPAISWAQTSWTQPDR